MTQAIPHTVQGFSKMSKEKKLKWLENHFLSEYPESIEILKKYTLADANDQIIYDRIAENPVANYTLPYGIAPNFVINDKAYAIPMVTEESSVIAAAAGAAKFWMNRGGFQCKVIDSVKLGQIHFYWNGDYETLFSLKSIFLEKLKTLSKSLTENMEKRGGGILDLELKRFPEEPGYYQFLIHFNTCNSMGANFINSILENYAQNLKDIFLDLLPQSTSSPEIVMSILSNYTPDCLVRAEVSCPIDELQSKHLSGKEFCEKFSRAIKIAEIDTYRATTHNKGIMNGIDAVVMATGNDFRAIEASAHAYAAKEGKYQSLSHCRIEDGHFYFWMDIPIAVGTVGGLTNIHPLAHISLQILGQPSAENLMQIIASAGLAQNFAAVKSLITTGIQQGHMKMHLLNILNHIKSSNEETQQAVAYFKDKVVSFSAVRNYILAIRND
ncbi:hydroxymethylglutaryl-CoA reductase, degradative [Membranihabitans marinus]|uniref:hydroxymethylglutaryl-CoA reductase, degradative n=1 Tax=Membranihabitans marinus TaxID=1227546 RepID=UPI001EFFFF43|nr:hydroxymethylglutaryl-CoA reductase, degradative [Membranihabitans marinus]